MDKAGKIRLGDKDIKLLDLKVGDEVTVTFEKDGERLIAKEIRVERK